jgi:uncharacterized protein (TIGR02996 family)
MTDGEALLQAILAEPNDDLHRRAYADWHQERGDPRGEFIHVQCALARLPEHDDRWGDLAARERDLLARSGAEWAGPLEPFCHDWIFRRGFAEWVRLRGTYACPTDPDFLDCLSAVAARTPVRDNQCTPDEYLGGVAELARSPHAVGLCSFRMAGHTIGDGIVRILAAAPGLPALEGLDLSEQWMTDAGLDLLASSPLGGRLRRFRCACNPFLTLAGVERLLEPGRLPRLSCLEVSIDGWADAGVGPLLTTNRLAGLTRLGLVYGVPDQCDGILRTDARPLAGLGELLRSEALPRLEELTLQGIRMPPAEINALASGPVGRRLVALTLERCLLGDGDVPLLLPLLVGGRLRRLALPYNELGEEAARLLACCPALSRLHGLDLEDNDLTPGGLELLASSPYRHPALLLQ